MRARFTGPFPGFIRNREGTEEFLVSNLENHNAASAKLFPDDPGVQSHLFEGKIGLELETQRIDRRGHLALTPHPFEEEPFIDRDFGEAQIEINTLPVSGAEEAEAFLQEQLRIAQRKLNENGELLWPFSSPPAITDDSEIRIAEYTGELEKKTVYRRYLAAKYGKRVMTLCGIHFNYSFSEEILKKSFDQNRAEDYRNYKDNLYLQLAEKVLVYSWAIVALLSASPLIDSSYIPGRQEGRTVCTGYSSLRCGREGYWNPFDPVLSYENVSSYSKSIRQYRDKGLLKHEGELYYPVRIKPAGKYSLRNLCCDGVDHIELRMIDLNPMTENGIDLNDLRFLQLFLIWLASKERIPLDKTGQERALRNQKDSACYDWDKVKICMENDRKVPMQQELEKILCGMMCFFEGAEQKWQDAMRHQIEKIRQPEKRYAVQVREKYGEAYLSSGMERAEQLQKLRCPDTNR